MFPIRPFPAMFLRQRTERVVIVTDLHIGWEGALRSDGIHIPSQTVRARERMFQLLKMTRPTRVIFLGDVKHTVAKAEFEEWQEIPDFFTSFLQRGLKVQVILGNHDGNLTPLLPEDIEVLSPRGIVLWDKIGLFHGHTWPAPELLRCKTLIMGHLHPIISFRDPMGYYISRKVWVKAQSFSSF